MDEPIIEELDDTIEVDELDSIGDEVGTITAGTIDIDEQFEKELKKPFRREVHRFPLDHSVRCGYCEWTGVVSILQLNCPKCNKKLISPKDVVEDD